MPSVSSGPFALLGIAWLLDRKRQRWSQHVDLRAVMRFAIPLLIVLAISLIRTRVYTGEFGGVAEAGAADNGFKDLPPHLEGIKIDGRWVVVYSKYDIGCALEGHKSTDCLGHTRESALQLATAAVLYALKR